MPMNNFTLGKDYSLTVVTTRGPLTINLLTSFTAKQLTNEIRVKGLDGVMRPLSIPDGWEGSFDMERQDGVVDAYFADLESAYYNGENILSSYITETVTEPNGGLSQFRFTGVMLRLEDAGAKAGDATVKQRIGWMASRSLKTI